MGALVRRLSVRNGPIGPVVTLSLALDVAADPADGALRINLGAGFLADGGRRSGLGADQVDS